MKATGSVSSGLGLVAGKAYILAVDYPEDLSRSIIVVNSGSETTNGFHTGTTVGDARVTKPGGPLPEHGAFRAADLGGRHLE